MDIQLIQLISDFENLVLDNFQGLIKGKSYREKQWKIVKQIRKVVTKKEEAKIMVGENFAASLGDDGEKLEITPQEENEYDKTKENKK